MKFISIISLLSLSCVDATQKHLRTTSEADSEKEGSLNTNHRDLESIGDGCSSTPQYTYSGQSTLISVTGAAFPVQGDVSIANELTPLTANYPKIKAACTLTAADPFSSAPFCTLETTIDSSGSKIMSMGTPPFLTIMGGTGQYKGAYGTMVTDENFTNAQDGTISFGAVVNYCLSDAGGNGGGSGENGGGGGNAVCTNNKKWKYMHNGRKQRCSWVADDSSARCVMMGKENGVKTLARDACQAACNPAC